MLERIPITEPKNKLVACRVKYSQYELIKQIMVEHNTECSSVLRYLIQQGLRLHQEEKPHK